jgi:integrase
VLTDDELRRLLRSCDGRDLDDQVVVVLGKGRRQRAVPFGRKTALALDRYLRLRASHTFAHHRNLWIGRAGAMTPSGLFQVVAERGASVGLPGLRPHQFRHSFAESWLSAGGNEGDLMRLAGWKSRQMVDR